MYDWPEVRAETDRLWTAIRDAVQPAVLVAPAVLDRVPAPADVWRSPDLLISQTCGLPYITNLTRHVALLGRPTYDVPGCEPGRYASAIVVRAGEPRGSLTDYRDAAVACNGALSQSGWAALEDLLPGGTTIDRYFGTVRITGAHRHSIQAVARGDADLAAIDCVAWALALRHVPDAQDLRILTWSAIYPSLPFITAGNRPPDQIRSLRDGLRAAIEDLAPDIRDARFLTGLEDADPTDYAALERPLRPA